MTEFTHRVICIAPVARIAALRDFVHTIDESNNTDQWFTAAISESGVAPATHSWASFACTDEEYEAWQGFLEGKADIHVVPYSSPEAVLLGLGLKLITTPIG